MSKEVTLTPVAGSTITLTNTYSPETVAEKDLAMDTLQTVKDNSLFNSGCSAVGDPHVYADEQEYSEKALKVDRHPWNAKHVASIRLFGGNSYVYLLPGDSLTITARSSAEALYYYNQKCDFLTVEFNFVKEGEEREEESGEYGPFIDLTTGIGDYANLKTEGTEEGPESGGEGGETENPPSSDPGTDPDPNTDNSGVA